MHIKYTVYDRVIECVCVCLCVCGHMPGTNTHSNTFQAVKCKRILPDVPHFVA